MTQEEFRSWINSLHEIAKDYFLGARDHVLDADAVFTGVMCGPTDQISVLDVNKDNPLALALMGAGLSFDDSWWLVLAHESGHIELNGRCIQEKTDPTDPNMQLLAAGLTNNYQRRRDFHKESAIEAFCDAIFVNQAMEILGGGWEVAVKTLLKLRNSESARLGVFDGDEYATQPVLKLALANKQPVNPKDAAELTLKISLDNERIIHKRLPSTSQIGLLIVKLAENLRAFPQGIKSNIRSRVRSRRRALSGDNLHVAEQGGVAKRVRKPRCGAVENEHRPRKNMHR